MPALAPRDAVKLLALPNDQPNAVHIPEAVVDFVHQECPPSIHALRLVYGLFFVGHARGASVHETFRYLASTNQPFVAVPRAHIAKLVGPKGARDNRWMTSASRELTATKLFDIIEAEGRALRVKLSKPFLAKCPATEKGLRKAAFARIAPPDLMLQSPYSIMAKILTLLHGNKNWPMFQLPKIASDSAEVAVRPKATILRISHLNEGHKDDVAREEDRRDLLGIRSWHASRSVWLKALQTVAETTGFGFLVMPVYDPWSDHVRGVQVKIAHEHTNWRAGTLYSGPASVRSIFKVTQDGTETLCRDAWTGMAERVQL